MRCSARSFGVRAQRFEPCDSRGAVDFAVQVPPRGFVARVAELLDLGLHRGVFFSRLGIEAGKRIEDVALEARLLVPGKRNVDAGIRGAFSDERLR